VCRQSVNAVDEAAAVVTADSEMLSSSYHEDDAEVVQLPENIPVVPVYVETVAGDEVPVLSPNSVIDDVEYFEIDARL